MDYEDLEENLNATIEGLYTGLLNLAAITRANGSPDDLANRLQSMAEDICRPWPTCRALHDLDPPPGSHGQS